MSRAKRKQKAENHPLVSVTRRPGDPRQQRTDADLLRNYLRDEEKDAIYVLQKPDALPASRELAERVLDNLAGVRAFADRLSAADVEELWRAMVLVLDAEGMSANEWAPAVGGYERSSRVLRNKPTVTDAQIRAAVAKHERQNDAAAELGIEPRQLRGRERRLGLQKRKSGRVPQKK